MTTPRPSLECAGASGRLPTLYASALHNLLDVNVVGTGSDRLIRAGGGYPTPWTRDASINAWFAASLLAPDAAARTLLSVCDMEAGLVVQDDQWWDQIVWAVAVWRHYELTGDLDFLTVAFPIARDTAARRHATHFDAAHGLYRGPAVMQDGISGYPRPPADPTLDSSFVLDHPDTRSIMCLSTNALYVGAYRAVAAMAATLGSDPAPFQRAADDVAGAVNRTLWREEAGTYGYFVHGPGPRYGQVDTHQEGLGLALAVLFDVADERRRELVYAGIRREPSGVVNVWPHVAPFDDDHPGRHNAICWPMVMGVWADAAAHAGRGDVFASGLVDLTRLFTMSDDHLYELYNATSGAVDGGWQQGRHWESRPDQTWSATTFLGLIHHRLAGVRPNARGLAFLPSVPPGWGPVTLRDLPYRAATLDIAVTGDGGTVGRVRLDGEVVAGAGAVAVPGGLAGHHRVDVELN